VLTDNNALFTFSHTAPAGDYTKGARACLSGAQSADTNNEHIVCGTVVGSQTVKTTNNFTLIDAGLTTVIGQDGDSGGPYGSGGDFLGIHAGYSKSLRQSYMSKASSIARQFNAVLVY
jgi:hypothetical protein